ncbi:MAG: HD domain-containing protein [Candidatus Zixiibacteriota bacterium]|nr:MAG: HD domain-containing protein [candidate division Zixibacteria bacterium]
MKSDYVAGLAVGDEVSDLFAVRTVEFKEYSGGKMIILELVDRTGRIKGILWEGSSELMRDLKAGGIYKVSGTVTTYKSENQITVNKVETCKKFDLDDFLPRGEYSYEELERRLDKAIAGISDPDYGGLLKNLFSDGELKESFLNGVGGKLWHHNYIGGLAEHSFAMFDLCDDFCRLYKELDRELLLTGAIAHDIGKIRTYSLESAIDYTSEGRLLGHIVMGDEIIRNVIDTIGDFPDEKALKLRHLILSHQGTLEQASPVVPMMPESMALYAADLLDSKLAAFRRIRTKEKRPGVEWSNYVNLLNRHLYFGSEEDENG